MSVAPPRLSVELVQSEDELIADLAVKVWPVILHGYSTLPEHHVGASWAISISATSPHGVLLYGKSWLNAVKLLKHLVALPCPGGNHAGGSRVSFRRGPLPFAEMDVGPGEGHCSAVGGAETGHWPEAPEAQPAGKKVCLTLGLPQLGL
jgi:hypothetical protein